MFQEKEGPFHVEIELGVEEGLIHVRDRREAGHAGVDEQHIDPAVDRDHLIHQSLDGGDIRRVGHHHFNTRKLRPRGLGGSGAGAGHDHRRPLGLE